MAWQQGHKLVLSIYRLADSFPAKEQFGLTSQLRRAGVSITSNIAEGFSRSSYKEKIYFYCTALGSLTEVQNQFFIARDIGYINEVAFYECDKLILEISKLLNGLIKKSRSWVSNS